MNIELTAGEAMLVLPAIQDRADTSAQLAATSTGDIQEIADLASIILNRVATRIADELYAGNTPLANPSWEGARWTDRLDEAELGLA